MNENSVSNSTIVQPSKLMSTSVHDEDIELENKSILLIAQRKPVTSFSFGHKKTKAFSSSGGGSNDQQSYAKQLTKKSKNQKKPSQPSALDDAKMVDDLMESLPQ